PGTGDVDAHGAPAARQQQPSSSRRPQLIFSSLAFGLAIIAKAVSLLATPPDQAAACRQHPSVLCLFYYLYTTALLPRPAPSPCLCLETDRESRRSSSSPPLPPGRRRSAAREQLTREGQRGRQPETGRLVLRSKCMK
ncbi:hypothetical protein U9M48_022628, partial [Paspalum notatum var. saurae]